MSKLSFRARTLDSTKRMPIFLAEDLPDLSEYAAINRSVPQMPSGMEKEEEMEYHLQQAITARQASTSGAIRPCPVEAVIPIPKVEVHLEEYNSLYADDFKPPKQLIRVQAALSLEPEYPEYDLDDEDGRWLRYTCERLRLDITALEFERIMDTLEKQSEFKVISAEDAKLLLQADDDIILAVYDYWLNKRYLYTSRCRRLIPRVRAEKRDTSAVPIADPYVGFRRRAEKMQTRKNRKNDEESYEKILKLRNDLQKALTLLEMVKRREKSKRELIKLGLELANKRLEMKDYNSDIYNQLKHEVKPMFQFSKEEMLIGRYRRQSNRKRKLKEDKELVSREYLLENAESWYKPALFPSTSLSSPSRTSFPSHLSPMDGSLSSYYADLADKNLPDVCSRDKDSAENADGKYSFKRRRGCMYFAPCQQKSFDSRSSNVNATTRQCWPWEEPNPNLRYANCCFRSDFETDEHHYSSSDLPDASSKAGIPATVPPNLRYIGLARRRVGRGGRILFDRVSTLKEVQILEAAEGHWRNGEFVDQPSTSSQETLHKHYPKPVVSSASLPAKIPIYYPCLPELETDNDLISLQASSQLSSLNGFSSLLNYNFCSTTLDDGKSKGQLNCFRSDVGSSRHKTFVTLSLRGGTSNQGRPVKVPLIFGVTPESYSLNALTLTEDLSTEMENNQVYRSNSDDKSLRRTSTGIYNVNNTNNNTSSSIADGSIHVSGNTDDTSNNSCGGASLQDPDAPRSLDSRRAFEATAAVMTPSQISRLVERYDDRPPFVATSQTQSSAASTAAFIAHQSATAAPQPLTATALMTSQPALSSQQQNGFWTTPAKGVPVNNSNSNNNNGNHQRVCLTQSTTTNSNPHSVQLACQDTK